MNTFIKLPMGFEWVRLFIVKKEVGVYSTNTNRGVFLTTTFPIEVCLLSDKKVYRLCPQYYGILVSKDASIYNIVRDKYLSVTPLNKKYSDNHYNVVYPYNQLFNKYDMVLVHRLVGMCWVDNDDFKTKYVIDHIDGVKYHNHADNLEWVTPSKNASRASNKVLNKTFYIKNLNTGKVYTAHSTTEICEIIHRPKLYKRIDEMPFKYKNEYGEWVIEDKDNFHNFEVPDSKLEVSIKYKDGTIKKFKDIEELKRYLIKTYDQRWATLSNSKKIKKFLDSKGIKLITNKDYSIKKLSAKHLKFNLEYNNKTISELAKLTGVSLTAINRRSDRNSKVYGTVINDWLFKNDEDEDYPEPKYVELIKGVTARKGNDIKSFRSMREASRFFNVDRKTIMRKIEKQDPLFGYLIKYNNIA